MMPVICFADGASPSTAQAAARHIYLASKANRPEIAYLGCRTPTGRRSQPSLIVPSRRLIAEVRHAKENGKDLVLDASNAPDHILALAIALADFVLLPLSLDDIDDASFLRTIGLFEIVCSNMRQPRPHAIFLATSKGELKPSVHHRIAGLLVKRGLKTLAVPFCTRDKVDTVEWAAKGDIGTCFDKAFTNCVITSAYSTEAPGNNDHCEMAANFQMLQVQRRVSDELV